MADNNTYNYTNAYSIELALTESQIIEYAKMTTELSDTYPEAMKQNSKAMSYRLEDNADAIAEFEKIGGKQKRNSGIIMKFKSGDPTQPDILALTEKQIMELVDTNQISEMIGSLQNGAKEPKKFGQTKFGYLKQVINADTKLNGGLKPVNERGAVFKLCVL